MNKNFQEYTEIPIDLGHRDPACQTAFGKPHLKGQNDQKKKKGQFVMYLRKSHWHII